MILTEKKTSVADVALAPSCSANSLSLEQHHESCRHEQQTDRFSSGPAMESAKAPVIHSSFSVAAAWRSTAETLPHQPRASSTPTVATLMQALRRRWPCSGSGPSGDGCRVLILAIMPPYSCQVRILIASRATCPCSVAARRIRISSSTRKTWRRCSKANGCSMPP